MTQFKTDELKLAWDEWIAERKDRKLKKYTDRGMKAAITNLLNLAGQDESIAVLIINQSIAQGWQGLFPLKTQTNEANRGVVKPNGTSTSRIEALKQW